ncbi:HD-GYP domain-containing protein [Colwellia sp. RSH04]|uniref:HD-GYP domain-containing protein n=1 Tax=Colwellia sp. RSH04 TaxID=2305464 RepID=UPI000E584847|nr:HD-GYP domain-containing protein [Colwellia sp. RSH04]RHW76928.1 HD-GYP domain-containing protein [Colwellia sp. RSH04]
MLTEKKISEVAVGHYVVKIAEQEGQFSLTSPGHIKSLAVINNLKNKKVYSVIIDESKTITSPSPESSEAVFKEQIQEAKVIFDESKNIQKQLFSDALTGSIIELGPVVDITNKSIEAVFTNPDSLACMVNIRQKDEYLLEHSVAVSVYITLFARYLKLNRKIIEQLAIGAFLHDIGKIKIPDEILNKPGKLTDEEFTVMKTHANHSIDIIKKTPGISKLALEVAALHHEKLDGNGYPFKVPGDKISKYGRMIAICDIFDALTATRVYKKGFSHNKAFAILRELGQKNHLDAKLVDHFIRCVGVFPVGTLVQLESKKLAVVKERNNTNPINPKVHSFYSVKLNHFLNAQEIDLNDSNDAIVKGVRAEDFNLDMNKIIEMLLMDG